jgi:hypothetical protein
MYVTLFGALAASLTSFTSSTLEVAAGNDRATRAYVAAESGMSFLMLQFKTLASTGKMPVTSSGTIDNALAQTLFSGSTGLEKNLATQLNGSANLRGKTVIYNATTLQVPPIPLFGSTIDDTCFALTIAQDSTDPHILHCTSTGRCTNVMRSVRMDINITKQLKYAVYSNVAIQLGKNVRVLGDIASAYNGTGKGPPIQMFSDFHDVPNLSQMDTDLNAFRTLLNKYDASYTNPKYANRLDVRDPAGAAAVGAKKAGLTDANGDGFLDDFDLFLKNVDASKNDIVSSGEFIDPHTGKPYDSDLWTLIDAPMGTLPSGSLLPWPGYKDGQIASNDNYAKVAGSIKTALTLGQWQSAASGWSQWGDGGGKRVQDMLEGPVIPTDPNALPVQFGYDFGQDITLTPQNFDSSGLDAQIPSGTAAVSTAGGTTSISNGTLTAAMANGTRIAERFPSSASSGWQATYSRPVFQNVHFNNVRIPKGLNAKFINCTFDGYTSVKMNATITTGGTVNSNGTVSGGTTTYDPSQGMNWAQLTTNGGSFGADGVTVTTTTGTGSRKKTTTTTTPLDATNSVAALQGNNLHFTGCNFNGVMSADTPTAYTHFANSWEFDGTTTFNNQVDQSVTIMAANTNIEIGGYTNPGGNPSTLVGVIVAGNIDVRGTANVDGSLIVTGNGATNTTLGYFGSTDSGQAVPSPGELPANANGTYGHLFFRYNPARGMPNGISIPITLVVNATTYNAVQVPAWPW